ncbi:hypothetical protein BYT27DRAFT_7255026 [Phlegmacium glaucopus]|nr:hypothetical protein BYT27DRAFT_7255026 [Phlegmacium glaucopus]
MVNVAIADHGTKNIAQDNRIHKASIFELLLDPNSHPASLLTSPDVTLNLNLKCSPRVYGPKAHHRIIFKERGESLHNLSCLRQIKLPLIMQAMQDVLKALAFMTKKGYVHQDISPRNTIIYNGHAKLNDLEFAKQYGTTASNNVHTWLLYQDVQIGDAKV